MSTTVNWKLEPEQKATVKAIVERAVALAKASDVELDALSVEMDLTATHNHACPLRLEELLAADDFNFGHDVFGIVRHLDRREIRLTDCFVPRFADRAAA